MNQKCRTILIPEIGLILEPEFVQEIEIGTSFSRVLAHIVGQAGDKSVIIEATTDGRLHVASAGTAMEDYLVETGAAPDAYNAGSTFEQATARYVTDFLIETFAATISFRDVNGNWGNDISLPVGFFSKDFIHYGVRIQNRVALSVAAYEINMYW